MYSTPTSIHSLLSADVNISPFFVKPAAPHESAVINLLFVSTDVAAPALWLATLLFKELKYDADRCDHVVTPFLRCSLDSTPAVNATVFIAWPHVPTTLFRYDFFCSLLRFEVVLQVLLRGVIWDMVDVRERERELCLRDERGLRCTGLFLCSFALGWCPTVRS